MSFSEGSFNKDIGWNVVCLVLLWLHLVFQYLPLHLTDYTLALLFATLLYWLSKLKSNNFFSEIISKMKLLHFVISSIDDMKCIYIDDTFYLLHFFSPMNQFFSPFLFILFLYLSIPFYCFQLVFMFLNT